MIINPIIYKSYYYDTESDMYYLNSRYYNPLIARFITPDSYEYIDINEKNSYNLYVYCNNNPVMYADPKGDLAILTMLIGAGIGAIVGAATSAISQGLSNGFDKINGWQVFFDGIMGGISGALGASGITKVVSTITGAVLGTIGSVGVDLIVNNGKWSEVNVGKAIFMGVLGGFLGAWTGAGSQNMKSIVSDINAGKTWGSKVFLSAAEAFGKQQSNRTMQQVMYISLNKAISLHAVHAFVKLSGAIATSTIIGGII